MRLATRARLAMTKRFYVNKLKLSGRGLKGAVIKMAESIRVSSPGPERETDLIPPSIDAIWKGENESDAEYVEPQDPLE